MADDRTVANYEINLKDGTSGAAASAAGALNKLRDSIDRDTKALAAMQRAMKNLQQGSVVNVAQFRELKAKIDAKKESIAQAQSSFLALGGSFSKTGSSGKSAANIFQLLAKNAQGMGGPLSGVVGQLGSLRGLLAGGVIAFGVTAVAAAFVALGLAIVGATAAMIRHGLASANARRDELLQLEGLTKLRNWYGIAAGNAGEMQAAIDKVSASSALGRGKIAEYAQQLYKAHLRGDNFTLALEAMAIKSVAVGEQQAQAFAGLAAGINMTGGSVKRLSDDVKARFGGVAARAMLAWGVQVEKMRENIDHLFDSVKIDGFLAAIAQITSLFSQATATGRALKAIITVMFQPFIGSVEKGAPLVKRFFQGMVIGALYVAIAVLTLRNWFRKTFADSDVLKGINGQTLALKAGLLAVSLLTGALIVMAVPIAFIAAQMALVAYAAYKWYSVFKSLFQLISDIDWSELGSSIINGIINGLARGKSAVIDAVKGLGSAAAQAFKSVLGIASPSKEFAKFGRSIAQGTQQGVEQGTPDVRGSVGAMVPMPVSSEAPSAVSSGKSISITFGDIVVNSKGSEAKDLADAFRLELERVMQGVAIQLGAKLV